MQVPLYVIFALLLAVLLNTLGRGAACSVRAVLTEDDPPVAVGILFLLLFNGGSDQPVPQPVRHHWALVDHRRDVGETGLIAMSLWSVDRPFSSSTRAAVFQQLYESARLDGADSGANSLR